MNQQHRPHEAHRSKSRAGGGANVVPCERPADILDVESDEVCELLERLDDVVYSAIRGSESALEQAELLWPKMMSMLGWRLVEESREQYLRYAIDVSRQFDEEEVRDSKRMIAALEVISLLMRE